VARTPRSTTTEEDAALYESHVVPRYTTHFSELVLAELGSSIGGTVLDVGCGTGHPTFELLGRLAEGGRIIAVDSDSALLDLARRRGHEHVGTRVFFKVADARALDFGDEVFDVVVGNLLLEEVHEPAAVLSELIRVLAPGGRLLVTRPLSGTFEEVLDMFREVALRHDLPAVHRRADEVAARYPTAGAFGALLRAAELSDIELQQQSFRLSFRNAKVLFTDPVVRFLGLPSWRWIAGFEPRGLEHLEEVERCLDVYFGGGPLSLTVNAGLATGTR